MSSTIQYTFDQMDTNRTALVTGGNRGIGLAICEGLADRGVHVVMGARDEETGEDAAASIRERGGSVRVEQLDVIETASIEACKERLDADDVAVDALVNRGDVDGVVTVGGTGIDTRDITVEAVHPLFEKALPGFGELFRRHYNEAVGTDVIATRAAAGIADGTPVFCLPGTVEGARLGTKEIVVEQIGRLSDRLDEEP